MMFKTHLAFGALIALVSLEFINPANKIIFFIIVLFASLLPDIDSTKSYFGRRIKIIGWLFKHRGFFHSFIAAVLISFIFLLLTNPMYAAAIFIGYFSHILGDALTREGVTPFQPLSKAHIRGFFKTGGIVELLFLIAILLCDIYGISVIFLI